MKRILAFITLGIILTACGNKVDDDVVDNLANSLEARWEYTNTLPKEVTVDELKKAVEIELDSLKDYDYKNYKNGDLFLLYEKYKNDLNYISIIMNGKSADDLLFQKDWEDHMNERKTTLYEINEISKIDVSNDKQEILDELINEGKELFNKQDEVVKSLSHKEIMLHLLDMTSKYSLAYTPGLDDDKKVKYLNEAITDINLSVIEIEDKYDSNIPPSDKLLKLADTLLLCIDEELLNNKQEAYNQAVKAGKIIGDISREYLNGELPESVKNMTGLDNAN